MYSLLNFIKFYGLMMTYCLVETCCDNKIRMHLLMLNVVA